MVSPWRWRWRRVVWLPNGGTSSPELPPFSYLNCLSHFTVYNDHPTVPHSRSSRLISRQGVSMEWGSFRRVWVRGWKTGRSLTFNTTFSYCHVFRGVTIDGVLDWILNLLTTLGTISNYSVTADLRTLQFTTAHAEPFPVCLVLTSRSLATASNRGGPSA
jgi:hypothetical protein